MYQADQTAMDDHMDTFSLLQMLAHEHSPDGLGPPGCIFFKPAQMEWKPDQTRGILHPELADANSENSPRRFFFFGQGLA